MVKFYQNLLTNLFIKQQCQYTFHDKGLFINFSLSSIPNDDDPAQCHAYINTFKELNHFLSMCVWVLLFFFIKGRGIFPLIICLAYTIYCFDFFKLNHKKIKIYKG